MNQGLHLSPKLTQSLVLSPQLQQSLALLQAPMLELQALVQQELEQNPVLEETPEGDLERQQKSEDGETVRDAADPAEPPADLSFDPAEPSATAEPVDDFQAEFDRLAQMDQEWRDVFTQANSPLRSREEDEEKRQFMMDSLVADRSLQQDLLEQLEESGLPAADHPVAEAIIGNIDDAGFLKATLEEIAATTAAAPHMIERLLLFVQGFDPAGVAARDLRECLMLQLDRVHKTDTLEYRILRDHFDLLSRRKIPELSRLTNTSLDDVQEAMARIARLDPRPGRLFSAESDQYVTPEVFVRKVGDQFVVSTNKDTLPHLRISNSYKDLMAQQGSAPEVRDYIREKIRAGKFLIKSLQLRQNTILNIAREIVNRQRDFMEHGKSALHPLTMNQVAEVVGVHETTVSRAVAGKYMETPHGVVEMRSFFMAGLGTSDGAGVSNTSVKDMVDEIFKHEDTTQPLSDDEVAKKLQQKGVNIARRTVAKYRLELNILPSHLRKVY